MAEITHLVETYGIEHLLFEDDNLTFDKTRALAIFRLIKQQYPQLTWTVPNGVQVQTLNLELLTEIRASGCRQLSLAVESGSPETLRRLMQKPLRIDKTLEVVANCRELGIRTTAFFVVGMPGETKADIEQSMNFARHLNVDSITVMTAVPLPGSPLFEQCLTEGLIPEPIPFGQMTTRSPVLLQEDYDAAWIDGVARKTMVHHAVRHPRSVARRAFEKWRASPMTTTRMMIKLLAAALGLRQV